MDLQFEFIAKLFLYIPDINIYVTRLQQRANCQINMIMELTHFIIFWLTSQILQNYVARFFEAYWQMH